MLHILYILLPIFGIILLGAFAERSHILPATTAKSLNQFVYWFATPPMLFSLMVDMRPEQFSWQSFVGFFLGTVGTYCITFGILRCLKYSIEQRTMAGLLATFPNAAFMGLPVILFLYPNNIEAKVAAGLCVVLPISVIMYVEMALTLRREKTANVWKSFTSVCATFMRNPIMVMVIIGSCIGLSGATLPDPIIEMARMMGATTAPCALFCMGMSFVAQITSYGPKLLGEKKAKGASLHWVKGMSLVLVMKLLCMPALVYTLCSFLGVKGEVLVSMTIMSSMPAGVLVSIFAAKYEVFEDESVAGIIIGTVTSVITIPLIMHIVL